jgi:hypothetical protein
MDARTDRELAVSFVNWLLELYRKLGSRDRERLLGRLLIGTCADIEAWLSSWAGTLDANEREKLAWSLAAR